MLSLLLPDTTILKRYCLEDGSTEPIDVKVVMTEETPPQPTTKEYFVFAVTEKNAPVETVTAVSVLVDDEWIPQDLRTVVASIGFNYTAIPGTVIKVKFVATGFITEEIDVTLQTESDESLIIPVTLHLRTVLIICKSKVTVLNILYLGLVMSNLINALMI